MAKLAAHGETVRQYRRNEQSVSGAERQRQYVERNAERVKANNRNSRQSRAAELRRLRALARILNEGGVHD